MKHFDLEVQKKCLDV